MDFRKLIAFGKTSFVMSIPKSWVIKNKLKKGDLIAVEEQEGHLSLSPHVEGKEERLEKADIDMSNMRPMIKRIIASLYKGGYDEIRIKFSTTEELKDIQQVIKDTCIGFEIVEQGGNTLTAKKISDTIYEEFDTILRRSFLFLKSISTESLDAAVKQDVNALNNVALTDANINKFTDFCRRVINKKGNSKFRKIAPIYYIIEELEKIGDDYKDMCIYLAKNKVKLNKNTVKVYGEINEFLEEFYKLFYKFDFAQIQMLGEKKNRLDVQIEQLFSKVSQKEAKVLFYLNSLLERIFNMNGAVIASCYTSKE